MNLLRNFVEALKKEKNDFHNELKTNTDATCFGFMYIFNQFYLGSILSTLIILCFICITVLFWQVRGIMDILPLYNETYRIFYPTVAWNVGLHYAFVGLLGTAVYYFSDKKYAIMKAELSMLIYTVFRLGCLMFIPTNYGEYVFQIFLAFDFVIFSIFGLTSFVAIIFAAVLLLAFFSCTYIVLTISLIYENIRLKLCNRNVDIKEEEITHTFPEKDTSLV